jgi:hypothetical protein
MPFCLVSKLIIVKYSFNRVDCYLFFSAIININLFIIQPVQFLRALIIKINFWLCFAVKIDEFIRRKNHGNALIENSAIRKCFNDKFSAYAIQVAAGNTDYGFYQLIHDVQLSVKILISELCILTSSLLPDNQKKK